MQDKDCRSLGRLVASFLPCIVQFDLLISDQLGYSLNIYQFDCSVLCFLIENSSNKRIKSTSCFIFLFEISKKKFLKKVMVEKQVFGDPRFSQSEAQYSGLKVCAGGGIPLGLWDCTEFQVRITGLKNPIGDLHSRENRESWQVYRKHNPFQVGFKRGKTYISQHVLPTEELSVAVIHVQQVGKKKKK